MIEKLEEFEAGSPLHLLMKINQIIEVVNSLGEKEEVKRPGHKCPYYIDDCPIDCKEVKPSWEEELEKKEQKNYEAWHGGHFGPEAVVEEWEERFEEEFSGDYCGDTKPIKDFIRKLLSERK